MKKRTTSQAMIERALRACANSGVTLLRTELMPDGKVVLFHSAANEGERVTSPDQALETWQVTRNLNK